MKNTRIIGIISVTVLLLSTITIYGYESSGNKNINTNTSWNPFQTMILCKITKTHRKTKLISTL